MTTYVLGSTIYGTFYVTTSAGVAANATAVTVTVTNPDGTTSTPTAANPSTGTYTYSFTPTLPGRHVVREVATGTNAMSRPSRIYDVWSTTEKLIISLDDARAAMNLPTTITVNDDEIQLYVAAATYIIEDICGAVLKDTITETHDGGSVAVKLWRKPAAITSVTVNGTALASTAYTADLTAGVVYCGGPLAVYPFLPGVQSVVVVYTVGTGVVRPNIVLAARTLVQHCYQASQNTPRSERLNAESMDAAYTPSGYLVPAKVLEWCKPEASNVMPGFA